MLHGDGRRVVVADPHRGRRGGGTDGHAGWQRCVRILGHGGDDRLGEFVFVVALQGQGAHPGLVVRGDLARGAAACVERRGSLAAGAEEDVVAAAADRRLAGEAESEGHGDGLGLADCDADVEFEAVVVCRRLCLLGDCGRGSRLDKAHAHLGRGLGRRGGGKGREEKPCGQAYGKRTDKRPCRRGERSRACTESFVSPLSIQSVMLLSGGGYFGPCVLYALALQIAAASGDACGGRNALAYVLRALVARFRLSDAVHGSRDPGTKRHFHNVNITCLREFAANNFYTDIAFPGSAEKFRRKPRAGAAI